MIEKPLISVVISTYNRPKYLKEAMCSVVNQTYKKMEILIMDDSSLDTTFDVVKSFNDSRIRYFKNDINLGMMANIIKGFKLARGKYIANLHDDDFWEKDFLERLVKPLEDNPDLVLSFCDYYFVDKDGRVDDKIMEKNKRNNKRYILREGIHTHFYKLALIFRSVDTVVCLLFRRSSVDFNDFPRDVDLAYDFWLVYLLSKSGGGAYYLPQRLSNYRVHDESTTKTKKLQLNDSILCCYKRFLHDPALDKYRLFFIRKCDELRINIGKLLILKKNINLARKYLSAVSSYFNIKRYFLLFMAFLPAGLASHSLKIISDIYRFIKK